MGFFSKPKKKTDAKEFTPEMKQEFSNTEEEYNRYMTEKFCPLVNKNCIGVGCVHFSRSWTTEIPEMNWYKTQYAKCKLWKN